MKGLSALCTLSSSGKTDWQNELKQCEEENTESELLGQDDASFIQNFVRPFIHAIQTNLLERFPTHDMDILSAGEIFDPKNLPDTPSKCYVFGREKVTTLASRFGCDFDQTVSEWKEVVMTLQDKADVKEVLIFIVKHSTIYPCLAKIASALLVVPMHSADCE